MSLLIVGCGYVGKALAQQRLKQLEKNVSQTDSTVYALTRTEENAQTLKQARIQPLVGHWLVEESLPELPEDLTQVLVAVPHREDPESGLPADSDQHHVQGLQLLLKRLSRTRTAEKPMPKLVYLSTTGVFGASVPGERVDETTPVSPTRIGPRIAVAAEQWLLANQSSWKSSTLRLAGIYGPGRVPLLQKLKEGQPLAVPQEGSLNLIHVEDIVQAIEWLFNAEVFAPLYQLSDGHPVRREEFYRYLSEIHGLGEPEFVDASPQDSRARRSTDKLVDSSLFWSQSKLTPIHADYRSGLSALL